MPRWIRQQPDLTGTPVGRQWHRYDGGAGYRAAGPGPRIKGVGGLVGEPLIEMQTLDQVMASRQDAPPSPMLELTEDERRTIVDQSLDRHSRDMLDQPASFLGNKSPRVAARTARGRVKVVDWLKMIENRPAESAGRYDELAIHDFNSWLWTELVALDARHDAGNEPTR
jgi:hypothetical protein